MIVRITRSAREDILESAKFIANDNPRAALRFIDGTESALDQISKNPGIGAPRTIAEQDLRMWFVNGFARHLVFYKIENDEIIIVRVIHSSKDHTSVFET